MAPMMGGLSASPKTWSITVEIEMAKARNPGETTLTMVAFKGPLLSSRRNCPWARRKLWFIGAVKPRLVGLAITVTAGTIVRVSVSNIRAWMIAIPAAGGSCASCLASLAARAACHCSSSSTILPIASSAPARITDVHRDTSPNSSSWSSSHTSDGAKPSPATAILRSLCPATSSV